MNSALKETIASLLGPDTQVWSYEHDFDVLWLPQQNTVDSFNRRQIILWARTPPGNCYPVNTDVFVSPLVWAVCSASRNPALKTHGVTIIDLSPEVHTNDPLIDQIRAFRQASIPWLTFLQWHELVVEDVDSLRDVVLSTTRGGSHVQPSDDRAFDQLRQTLRFQLTDPSSRDERHAVSNLIGPMILLGRAPTLGSYQEKTNGARPADHLSAFKTILEVCGLIPKSDAAPLISAKEPGNSRPLCSLSNAKIILLDDQWHQGWGEWVCQTLGLEYLPGPTPSPRPQKVTTDGSVEVFVASDPEWLIERLTLPDSETDKRLTLSLLDPQDGKDEILLLDLRLFSGQRDREASFVGKLIPLCSRFTRRLHAWQPFEPPELTNVQSWCADPNNLDGKPVSEGSDSIARSLLGRLIALTDFSLPILLFSSTGDRDMVKLLEPYGNIISSFSKPRTFSASQTFQADDIVCRFLGALESCERISNARQFLRVVAATADEVRATAKHLLTTPQTGDHSWSHADLYIDESGDPDKPVDHVGGCAVIYSDAESSPNQVFQALRDSKLIWGASREETDPRGTLTKAALVKNNAELDLRMKNTVATVGALCPIVGCVLRIPQEFEPVRLPGGPDLRYRQVASTLIEFFLYDWLPIIAEAAHRSFTVGIFVATRMWNTDLRTLIEAQWTYGCELQAFRKPRGKDPGPPNADLVCLHDIPLVEQRHVGFLPPPNKERYCLIPVGSRGKRTSEQQRWVKARTMPPFGAYEIVSGLVRQRSQDAQVISANGVTLRDGDWQERDEGPFLPRQVHYASDDLLAVLRRPTISAGWSRDPFLKSGFYATEVEQMETLLKASRATDSVSRLPEAINLLWTIWDVTELKALSRLVAARAAGQFEVMDGHAFLELVNLRMLSVKNAPVGASNIASQPSPPNALRVAGVTESAERAIQRALRRHIPEVNSGIILIRSVTLDNDIARVTISTQAGFNPIAICLGQDCCHAREIIKEHNIRNINFVNEPGDAQHQQKSSVQ